MSTADAVAAMLWTGVTAYAVFGGADFGAGFWSLFAGGSERGRRARDLIDWAIGPVWEANHVWLIFVLVVLWTGFSAAFDGTLRTGSTELWPGLSNAGAVQKFSRRCATSDRAQRATRARPRTPNTARHTKHHGHAAARQMLGVRA